MKKAKLDFEAIDELMDVRGLVGTTELARRSGMGRPHLYQLRANPEQASLLSITKLCYALRCQPGNILVLK